MKMVISWNLICWLSNLELKCHSAIYDGNRSTMLSTSNNVFKFKLEKKMKFVKI